MFGKKIAATVLSVGATTAALGALPAHAATQHQDGLVNVAVGDVSVLDNANVGVAAEVAANVCGVSVGPVAVLGRAVDRTGDARTVCTTANGPVRIVQNQ